MWSLGNEPTPPFCHFRVNYEAIPAGTPVYHGWPDRYGFLATSQAVFNPIGGASDDLCVFDATNPPSFCTPASLNQILSEDIPIADVLALPPAPIVAPIALEAADSSVTGIDFVPNSFVADPVLPGAALCGAIQPRRRFRLLATERQLSRPRSRA